MYVVETSYLLSDHLKLQKVRVSLILDQKTETVQTAVA
jgi:hypothetical protein